MRERWGKWQQSVNAIWFQLSSPPVRQADLPPSATTALPSCCPHSGPSIPCRSDDAALRRRQLRQAGAAATFPPLPPGNPPALDDEPDASYYGGDEDYRWAPGIMHLGCWHAANSLLHS